MILSLTFSQSFFEQNVSVQLKLLRLSAIFFQNKARNAGRSGENTGMREISQNAGFPARLTPTVFDLISGLSAYVILGPKNRPN